MAILNKDLPDTSVTAIDIASITSLSAGQIAVKMATRNITRFSNDELVDRLSQYILDINNIKAELSTLDDHHRAKRQADITRLTEKFALVVLEIRRRKALG